jgi:hypothetical protein
MKKKVVEGWISDGEPVGWRKYLMWTYPCMGLFITKEKEMTYSHKVRITIEEIK